MHILDQLLQIVQLGAKNPDTPVGSISLKTPAQEAILPNPAKDLEWSNFRGAIHDIFSANAQKHPDRECVIETPDFTDPESR